MKKQITTTEAEQLTNFIHAAKGKFQIKDIVALFLDSLNGWREKSEFVDALIKNEDIKNDIKEELQSEMKSEGFIVLKINSMDKMSKLNDFLSTDIYPYYNEQQKEMFA
jgi:hypothetical protein